MKASHHTVHGPVASAWQKSGDRFKLQLGIPVGASATVFLPAKNAASVTEGGRSLDRVSGVKFLRMEEDRAVLAVLSGQYKFVSR